VTADGSTQLVFWQGSGQSLGGGLVHRSLERSARRQRGL